MQDVEANYKALFNGIGAKGEVSSCETIFTQEEITKFDSGAIAVM